MRPRAESTVDHEWPLGSTASNDGERRALNRHSDRLPRVALIPDPDGDVPGSLAAVAPTAAAMAARAATTLAAIEVHSGRDARDGSLRTVAAQLDALAGCLPPTGDEAVPAGPPIHEYFRVRTSSLDPLHAAAHSTAVVAAAIDDLRDAALAGSDVGRLLVAMQELLLAMAGGATPSPGSCDIRDESSHGDPESRWFRRWIVAHQLHALMNVHASFAVRSATRRGLSYGPHLAASDLERATIFVSAFAPCRAYALALPSRFYVDVLRQTMVPPFTATPLNGRMHPEYRAYRAAVDDLLEAFPVGIVEMARVAPEFAFAREALFEADLIDAERHVTLVEPVVGQSKALGQSDRSRFNALGSLRSIRDARAHQFKGFTR